MSDTKFTQGKWSVGVYETTLTMIHRLIKKPQSCVCLVGPDGSAGMVIALCGDADDIQSQRDADLIAAAPEMYALLEQYKGDCDADNEGHSNNCQHCAFESILAKARGEF